MWPVAQYSPYKAVIAYKEFFLRFLKFFALYIITGDAVNNECTFQRIQVIVNGRNV